MKNINEKIILIAGIWLVVMPYTGFPSSWKTVFMIVTGLVLVYVGIALLKKKKQQDRSANAEVKTGTFTEVI
jgi:uncharacterized membrane protein